MLHVFFYVTHLGFYVHLMQVVMPILHSSAVRLDVQYGDVVIHVEDFLILQLHECLLQWVIYSVVDFYPHSLYRMIL